MTSGFIRTFLSGLDRSNKEVILSFLSSDKLRPITKYVIEQISKSDKELSIPLIISYVPAMAKLDLSNEQIDLLIDTYFSENCLDEIFRAFSLGFNLDQMKLVADPAYTRNQMAEIIAGFTNGLSFDKVKLYASPSIKSSKMYVMRVFTQKKFPDDQVKFLANSNTDMLRDADIEKYDLDFNQIKFALSHASDSKQFKQIILGFVDNLLEKEVSVYANPSCFNSSKMEFLRKALNTSFGFSDEILNFISGCYDFTTDQLGEIISGFESGLTLEQVQIYAKTQIDPAIMKMIAYDIANNIFLGNTVFYTFENGKYLNLIRDFIKKGLQEERIVHIIYGFSERELRIMSFEDLLISALAGLSCKQLLLYSNKMLFEYLDQETRTRLIKFCKGGVTFEEAEFILKQEEFEALDEKIVKLLSE